MGDDRLKALIIVGGIVGLVWYMIAKSPQGKTYAQLAIDRKRQDEALRQVTSYNNFRQNEAAPALFDAYKPAVYTINPINPSGATGYRSVDMTPNTYSF